MTRILGMRPDPRPTPRRIFPLRASEPIVIHSGGNSRVIEALSVIPRVLRDTALGIGFLAALDLNHLDVERENIHFRSADLCSLHRRNPASVLAHVYGLLSSIRSFGRK